MPRKKPTTYEFRTVADMQAIPVEKLGAFCEDLRSWLTIHRIAEATGELKPCTPLDMFGWIDDGKHNIKINLYLPAPAPPAKAEEKHEAVVTGASAPPPASK